MKLLSLLTTLSTAVAFTIPSNNVRSVSSSTNTNAVADKTFGVGIEFGNKCPPLGAIFIEESNPASLAWFQNAELKHGRSAMLATIGFLVQKYHVHLPLYLGPSGSNVFHPADTAGWMLSPSAGISFADIAAAAPLDAIQMVPMAGWLQIFAVCGWFECVAYHRMYNQGGRVPGDFGFDPLGFTKRDGGLDSDEMKKLRLKEIKNGRVAMMTIAAWASAEAIPGSFPVWHP